MVICLFKKREIILKVTIFSLLFIFVYSLSYFLSYIKYDDKGDILDSNLMKENERLRKELLDVGIVSNKDGILAKVMLRDIYGFYDELVLNVGTNVGVEVNDAVLNYNGLVGIVTKVEKNKCNVKLLTNDFNISVRINATLRGCNI